MAKVTKDGRTRNFACMVYEDSAPKNWQEILHDCFVPCFISPYHDKDINPGGELKKPHWHVMIMFENVKTKEQALKIFNLINGVGCEVVNSLHGYARYLCHLDDPGKAQYDVSNVRALCGADYFHVIGSSSDKYKAICEIMDFCDKYKVYSYQKLLQYCRSERFDWFRVLCDNGTYVVLEYLKSAQWTEEQGISTDSMPVNWWDNKVSDL